MMLLENFHPRAKLEVATTQIHAPKFTVIDAHNHLAEPFGGGWDKKPLSELLDVLDEAGVFHFVDLDGGWGDEILITHLEKFKQQEPDRFSVFCGIDWNQWGDLRNRFPEWAAQQLVRNKGLGASGLKVWKDFGLKVRDPAGNLVCVDDERLNVIWETAAELGLPILIHIADPVAFFDPVDEYNERWEELQKHPDWVFASPPFPPFNKIIEGFARLVRRHPQTVFIGAHVGCYAENLQWVGALLERCPNFYIDISARIAELGRQPYSAKRFFDQYSDRILFGIDVGPDLAAYRTYYRFLESADEYFSYNPDPDGIPDSGRWMIYGLGLSDDVLKRVYQSNAMQVLNLNKQLQKKLKI